jgi:hypothetical protein
METVIIPYEDIVDFKKTYSYKDNFINKSNITEVISNYKCFTESDDTYYFKKHYKKNKFTNGKSNKERPRIGNQDISKEAIITKDFQGLLNKLSKSNYSTILISIEKQFIEDNLFIYIEILWKYFQKQPNYQDLYINILDNIYELIKNDDTRKQFNQYWKNKWVNFINNNEWIISKQMIKDSLNDNENEGYDEFCDYVKEKKRLIAVAQSWARMYNSNYIQDIDTFIVHLIESIINIDTDDIVDVKCVECYTEQCITCYQIIKKFSLTEQILKKIEKLKSINMKHKSCLFKIEKLVSILKT